MTTEPGTASRTGFSERSFRFLAELEAHNDAGWFREHKADFTEDLEGPFADLLAELTTRLADSDAPLSGSRSTMFRMNRDVRFSADKSPYKTAVSGLLTPSGTKAEDAGLVYLQVGAQGGFVAGGLYTPSPKRLGPVRDRILADPERFDAVVERLEDAGLALDTDAALRMMPRGYAEHADHPLAWALRLTTLITRRDLPTAVWTSGEVVDRVEEFTRGAAPLLDFVRSAQPAGGPLSSRGC